MPQFKVGDAVRVKAGSPIHLVTCLVGMSMDVKSRYPRESSFGVRLDVNGINQRTVSVKQDYTEAIGLEYLEPWRDDQHWDGERWVDNAKSEPKPAIVMNRCATSVGRQCDSTNEAARLAKKLAEENPGQEYVIYQEKGSEKVEVNSSKRYTFSEAYAMMKAGKWMKPIGVGHVFYGDSHYTWILDKFLRRTGKTISETNSLCVPCIEAQWEEVA